MDAVANTFQAQRGWGTLLSVEESSEVFTSGGVQSQYSKYRALSPLLQ